MTIVKKTLGKRPIHSPERAAELRALDAAQSDDNIDYTDNPPMRWDGAVRGRFYRPVKEQVTARIDADVLHWLKSGGEGYQTRLNAILRNAMMAAQRAEDAPEKARTEPEQA